jgi:hypothetical protein
MNNITRRSLMSGTALGLATLGLFSAAPQAAEGQLVWKVSEWKLAEFQKLVNDPARIKQLYDIVQIARQRASTKLKQLGEKKTRFHIELAAIQGVTSLVDTMPMGTPARNNSHSLRRKTDVATDLLCRSQPNW